MTWLSETEGSTPLERVLRKRPALFRQVAVSVADVWSAGVVDAATLELCRLAVADTHRCRSELSIRYREAAEAGLSEEKISALSTYESSPLFSERERACVRTAAQYALDAHGISDEAFADLRTHLTDAEAVTLMYSLTVFDGLARLRTILDIEPLAGGPVQVTAPGQDGPLY
jgi:alkylhydroperoxidase family enzyme